MAQNSYTGTALVVTWTTSGATVTPSAEYTTFTATDAIDLFEQTAGDDTDKYWTVGPKSSTYAITFYMQSGSNLPGTATLAQMEPGQIGTLAYSPEGTGAGKRKWSLPAIALGNTVNLAYNGNVTAVCNFQSNGARTAGTN